MALSKAQLAALNNDIFPLYYTIGLNVITEFNYSTHFPGAYMVIKGSTLLRYITPPRYLNDPAYLLANPCFKSHDLDCALIVPNASMADVDTCLADIVNYTINYFASIVINYIKYPAYQLETILNRSGFTINLGASATPGVYHSFADLTSKKININSILNMLHVSSLKCTDIHNGTHKDVKKINIMITDMATRTANIPITMFDLSIVLTDTHGTMVHAPYYYTRLEQIAPLYVTSPTWLSNHPPDEEYKYLLNTDRRYFTDIGLYSRISFISLPYTLNELHRLLNINYGPYHPSDTGHEYWKRNNSLDRIRYLVQLLNENKISATFIDLDPSINTADKYNTFKDYLLNRIATSPFYDFKGKKVLVTPADIGAADFNTTQTTAHHEFGYEVFNRPETQQIAAMFNDAADITMKAFTDFIDANNAGDLIRSWVSATTGYSHNIAAYQATGNNKYMQKSCFGPGTALGTGPTVMDIHLQLCKLFQKLDITKFHNNRLPSTYYVYRGLRFFHVTDSSNNTLNFYEYKDGDNWIIKLPAATSTTNDYDIALSFNRSDECCLLCIQLQNTDNVLFLGSYNTNEQEIVLPPNTELIVDDVQYVYCNNINKTQLHSYNKYNIITVVFCRYRHSGTFIDPKIQAVMPSSAPKPKAPKPKTPKPKVPKPAVPAGGLAHPAGAPAGGLAHPAAVPAGSLAHPAAVPAGGLAHPAGAPAGSLAHPAAVPAGGLAHPAGAPAGGLAHPAAVPAGGLAHPAGAPAGGLAHPAGAPAGPTPLLVTPPIAPGKPAGLASLLKSASSKAMSSPSGSGMFSGGSVYSRRSLKKVSVGKNQYVLETKKPIEANPVYFTLVLDDAFGSCCNKDKELDMETDAFIREIIEDTKNPTPTQIAKASTIINEYNNMINTINEYVLQSPLNYPVLNECTSIPNMISLYEHIVSSPTYENNSTNKKINTRKSLKQNTYKSVSKVSRSSKENRSSKHNKNSIYKNKKMEYSLINNNRKLGNAKYISKKRLDTKKNNSMKTGNLILSS